MKRLEMIFRNELGRSTKISVDYVKDDVTKKEVETVMQSIIDKNIFKTENGELKEIDGADIVSTNTVELI
ncbi:MAG: DUF2922 domain-containing protein [Anaeromicrobium sp.]|jgi:hypothetical protein|uniref:DUF2922 domain-containing protein n=1 Tax=Anaeromicrobium sp. TaxID=1929132 RepID=UPI0025DBC18B|nr:DUF2922 domain-containing protein [Anaeromicrobium sp.]MCT4594733.1 DUF2922 domain-containing protein [Anaeromicrobium sp.]